MIPVLILAGGFGTRLRGVVGDVPKPLASISGKPFIYWLLKYLQSENITDVYLSVGYKSDQIMSQVGDSYGKIRIRYIVEEEPLGTGGAIVNALDKINAKKIMVINGDTLSIVDFDKFITASKLKPHDISIATIEVKDASRYGKIETNSESFITSFREKGETGSGSVNCGVYLINKSTMQRFKLTQKFSWEQDFISQYLHQLQLLAVPCVSYFIDIGVPDDYALANEKIPDLLGKI